MARAVPGPIAAGSLRAIRFGVVGLTGVVVNQAVLVLMTEFAGLHYLASAILATESSTLWNFILIDRWALAGRARGSAGSRLLAYAAVNNASLILRLPLLWLLTDVAGISYGFSNLVTLAILFVLRFAISDRWIWGPLSSPTAVAVASATHPGEAQIDDAGLGEAILATHRDETLVADGSAGPAAYRYDIGGILRVD